MAYSAEVQCIVAALNAENSKFEYINDKTIDDSIRNPQSKAKYAYGAQEHDINVAKSKPFTQSYREEAMGAFRDLTGVDPNLLGAQIRDPSGILGEDIINLVNSVYEAHIQRFGSKNKDAWKKNGAKQLEEARKRLMPALPPEVQNYAGHYFEKMIKGEAIWPAGGQSGPITTMVRNAVGNLVEWNPVIAALNVFEFLPKAYAFAAQNGDISGVSVLRALRKYGQQTGLNFSKRVQGLDDLGIYGSAKGFSILDLTENPLRGLSYTLGEELGVGGRQALEKVAFVPRYGNRPLLMNSLAGADSVALMRFSISAWKFYSGMVSQAVKGNKGAIAGLAGFTAMTALQSGGSSAIPAPIAMVMDQIDEDMLAEFDEWTEESLGFNLAKKMGVNIGEGARPLPGVAIGLGYGIAQQDVMGGLGRIAKATGNVADGDYGLGLANFLEGMMGVGLVRKFPGINMTTTRMMRTVRKQIEDEGGVYPEDLPGNFLQEMKLTTE